MNLPMNLPMNELINTLQQARKARRLSQLELSMRMGVSQRHVSFVESGRARPSRQLLASWLHELDAPLAVQNAAMLQAGYAPAYSAARLDDPALSHANEALVQLLSAHDPMPAMVLDADWNLLHMNRGCQWLAATLVPELMSAMAAQPNPAPLNLLDILSHPQGFTRHMTNLPEIGPTLLQHLRHEAATHPSLSPRVEASAQLLHQRLGTPTTTHTTTAYTPPTAPVLTSRFTTPHGPLAFFSMFTTFGTPQCITLASLRVEHMFAADDATRAVVMARVG